MLITATLTHTRWLKQVRILLLSDFVTYLLLPVSTMAKVRLELAEEELKRATSGSASVHDVSPNAFLHIGLDLEEHQYVLVLS